MVDSFLDEELTLQDGGSYSFIVDSDLATKGKRFYLRLSDPEPEILVMDGTLTSNYSFGNQWYFNGNVIDGATDPTFTPTESGLYSVHVCDFSAELEYIITGINISDENG